MAATGRLCAASYIATCAFRLRVCHYYFNKPHSAEDLAPIFNGIHLSYTDEDMVLHWQQFLPLNHSIMQG